MALGLELDCVLDYPDAGRAAPVKLDCCEVDPPLPVLGAVLLEVLLGGGDEVAALCGRDRLLGQAHGRAGAGSDLDEHDGAAALGDEVDLAGP